MARKKKAGGRILRKQKGAHLGGICRRGTASVARTNKDWVEIVSGASEKHRRVTRCFHPNERGSLRRMWKGRGRPGVEGIGSLDHEGCTSGSHPRGGGDAVEGRKVRLRAARYCADIEQLEIGVVGCLILSEREGEI